MPLSQPLRVATVPDRHPYLDAALPTAVRRIPSPPAAPDGPRGPWAPSRWLEPAVLLGHAGAIDLVHVHFGFDHLTVPELEGWLAAVQKAGVALVVTVHDIRNPHHDDRDLHDAHLSLLTRAADRVLTLTPGAAAELADRFGVEAAVIPHPPLFTPRPRPPRADRPTVGIHLKSLRRSVVDPAGLVDAAARGAEAVGARLQVDLHPDALDDPRLAPVRAWADAGRLELRVHERFTDDELAAYLASLDVSVVPNRFGTHSGWVESCRDLGTKVVVPTSGYIREQWPESAWFGNDEIGGFDPASLRAAVARAVRAEAPPVADLATWRERIDAGRRAHAEVYAAALEGPVLPEPRERRTMLAETRSSRAAARPTPARDRHPPSDPRAHVR